MNKDLSEIKEESAPQGFLTNVLLDAARDISPAYLKELDKSIQLKMQLNKKGIKNDY